MSFVKFGLDFLLADRNFLCVSFLYYVIYAKSLKLDTNTYHFVASTMTCAQVLNTVEMI